MGVRDAFTLQSGAMVRGTMQNSPSNNIAHTVKLFLSMIVQFLLLILAGIHSGQNIELRTQGKGERLQNVR